MLRLWVLGLGGRHAAPEIHPKPSRCHASLDRPQDHPAREPVVKRWVWSGRIFTACIWIIACIAWSMAFYGQTVTGVIFLVVTIALTHIREPVFIQHPPA